MTKTIAVLSDSWAFGGLERRIVEDVEVLVRAGYRARWLSPGFPEWSDIASTLAKAGADASPLALANPLMQYRMLWRLTSLARLRVFDAPKLSGLGIDGAVVAASWADRGLAQAYACSVNRIPFVLAMHNAFPAYVPSRFQAWFLSQALSMCRAVYGVSASAVQSFEASMGACLPAQCSLEAISNGVDLDRFGYQADRRQAVREQYGIDAQAFVLCVIARHDRKKRVHLAMEMLAALVGSGVDARAILVGSGPETPSIRELAKRRAVLERVTWVESTREPQRVLQASDCVFLGSESEGQGLVLIEGMGCGCVPIGFDVPGVRDVITRDRTGFLIEGQELAAPAALIARAWGDPVTWRGLQQAARADAEERFSQARMRAELRRLYDEVFAER